MSRLSILLFCFILLSYKNDNYKVNKNEDLIIFFKNFIALNKNKFNINKTKYIIYGDSSSFENWIKESKVDTIQLKKYLNSNSVKNLRNIISDTKPNIFKKHKVIKDVNSGNQIFNSKYYKNCELFSINFLVYNEKKNKLIIYYSQDCYPGFVEIYNKTNNNWVLDKLICRN